jgi:hypothetical protein
VRDQVSHPYKTAVKIMVLCVLIVMFSERRLEDVASSPQIQSALNFFVNAILTLFIYRYSNRLLPLLWQLFLIPNRMNKFVHVRM